ncbi:DUF4811 domain-containing protein [Secundilactobacillus folii]|uniref:DUF4811 domain-containing protein n=1 Tax=Secundilactobacillus folii TaxID=2678357 RepID=A0A7X3C400_9LACO|nr:DUF4811 domain-containing protein [Secundilactobacillus folii]MTV83101.1 DUF4811 domain-containing protein [Secundilactobacillus folii]
MVAIILFIGALLFSFAMIFMKPGLKKAVWVLIGLVFTVGSIVLMILNFDQYFGMKTVVKQNSYPLTSSLNTQQRVLMYKQIGTQNERVYLYKTNPLDKGLTKTDPAKGEAIVLRNAPHNKVTISRSYRVYRNEEFRLLFSAGVKNHTYVGTQWVFHLRPGWRVIGAK